MSNRLLTLLFGLIFLNRSFAYAEPEWKSFTGLNMANPPSLSEGSQVDKLNPGVVWTKNGDVHWVVLEDNKYVVLRWNMHSGNKKKVFVSEERIRGMAYSNQYDVILLRTHSKLEFYDPLSWQLIRSESFKKLEKDWRDIAVIQSSILVVNSQSRYIDVYDFQSLKKLRVVDTGRDKTQRLFRVNEQKIGVWSLSHENVIDIFHWKTGQKDKKSKVISFDKHLFAAKEMGANTLGYFDLNKPDRFKVFKLYGSLWVDASSPYEVLGKGFAYRLAPVTENITATFSIKNKGKSLIRKEAVFVIPSENYGQSLENESFPAGGTLFKDALGNRYLKKSLRMLPANKEVAQTFYKARLTRWYVFFDLQKVGLEDQAKKPEILLSTYLEDAKIYNLNHRNLNALFESRFEGIHPINNRVKSIFKFAKDDIQDIWDGKSESVPQIILNQHGGSTEHSYFQVAMLRKSGLPARFNWNSISRKTGDSFIFNHKFAEVWFPETGWIPMEPLDKKGRAGVSASYPFVFAVRSSLENPFLGTYDRLAAYLVSKKNNEFTGTYQHWKQAPIKVYWNRSR